MLEGHSPVVVQDSIILHYMVGFGHICGSLSQSNHLSNRTNSILLTQVHTYAFHLDFPSVSGNSGYIKIVVVET